MAKITKYQQLPCYKQKSKEWLDQRNNFLTASTIAAAIGAMGPVARKNLLINKVSYGATNAFNGSVATHWGNKYEPVANAIYSHRNHAHIYAFGLVTNPKYPELGVSPDGITIDNMIEIKCPYSRVIDGHIKTEYQHQIQEQLAVCEFDQSAFLECKFEELLETRFWDDFDYIDDCDESHDGSREKGIIMAYYDYDEQDMEYLYSPIECYTSRTQMQQWQQETLKRFQTDPKRLFLYQTYWSCTRYCCQMVQRDPEWIRQYYPLLQTFWKEVEHYRQLGLEALMAENKSESDNEKDVPMDPPDIASFYPPKTILCGGSLTTALRVGSSSSPTKSKSRCLL